MDNDIEERLSRLESTVGTLDSRVDALEKRVDTIEGKLDTLLDSTAELKNMLRQNTGYSKSAKNNSVGWGIIGFVSSLVMSAARLFL